MTNPALRTYDSVLDMLSNADNPTPIVRLNRVTGFKHALVYAKLEWYNPFGAVKDRVAANLLRDAEERGLKFRHLVEPTSGNTGMGLAMMANAKGYDFTATLSLAIPVEKRSTLRAFGAKLVELADDLCPLPGAPEGAMSKAEELAQQPDWHELNQYKNPANPEAHFRTTGPEVWRQTEGRITHFVAGLGTCGTITGTGRFLKSQNQNIKVLGVYPADGHDIPGVRTRRALQLTDFFLPQEYDGLTEIDNDQAYRVCKRLLQEESIIAGPSSGMALAGALKLVPDEPGVVCVVMFPDNVFKYTGSLKKHLPELFPSEATAQAPAGPTPEILRAIQELAENSVDVIDADTAVDLVRKGAHLLDVRTPKEFDRRHIEEATNVPLDQLSSPDADGLPTDRQETIVTICAAGKRSLTALLLLKAQGYQKVKSVRGGMNGWESRPLQIGAPAGTAGS
ncbi:MAG TPA: pyridoxal-phosphate dependent enzyme [Candidatus Xenobia bacterium]|jgi:cysteine synthase/rhodanese-related sulfurtransferase